MESYRIYSLVLILVAFYGCSSPNEGSVTNSGEFKLEKVGEKAFYLDSTLAPYNQSILTFEEDGTTKLSIFNHLNASVNVF